MRFLDIAEIRDDTVVVKDRGHSRRRSGFVDQFRPQVRGRAGCDRLGVCELPLNSLEHPIEVVIQSRKLNIDAYMSQLVQKEREQVNDLLRAQISDYRAFIKDLVELGEIMNKRFYIVVPFDPLRRRTRVFGRGFVKFCRPGSPSSSATSSSRIAKRVWNCALTGSWAGSERGPFGRDPQHPNAHRALLFGL